MTVFGDAEAAVAAILRASPAVVAIGNVRVATDLVGYRKPARWLWVVRTGGVPTLWMRLDNPTVKVTAYAERKANALDLAVAARGAIFAARGVYEGHGLALYDVGDAEGGLVWAPDEQDPTIARYTFSLSLVTRPA